jgi:hypothetical protein
MKYRSTPRFGLTLPLLKLVQINTTLRGMQEINITYMCEAFLSNPMAIIPDAGLGRRRERGARALGVG